MTILKMYMKEAWWLDVHAQYFNEDDFNTDQVKTI